MNCYSAQQECSLSYEASHEQSTTCILQNKTQVQKAATRQEEATKKDDILNQ
jgi:hypothetical protein